MRSYEDDDEEEEEWKCFIFVGVFLEQHTTQHTGHVRRHLSKGGKM